MILIPGKFGKFGKFDPMTSDRVVYDPPLSRSLITDSTSCPILAPPTSVQLSRAARTTADRRPRCAKTRPGMPSSVAVRVGL